MTTIGNKVQNYVYSYIIHTRLSLGNMCTMVSGKTYLNKRKHQTDREQVRHLLENSLCYLYLYR